ncbi:dienelactone hydrolase family protein [Massilia cavernae]|uniref:Alpha/beta hydrolase n=1 Tax=Massilia cavernae TaxID=2320864 RepID=A0A418Y884_9BURK|nr:alpha/beta hydrolase [Massilia cavernae]RJG27456.1 alpha/beta hydrolase [Massilia cavernae]
MDGRKELVSIPIDGEYVEGLLALPGGARGIILFAHGSGSGRLSPRNNYVAGELRKAGLGTLLMDLLTPAEEPTTAARFDIGLLAQRLKLAADWLSKDPHTSVLPLGLFGASTGAAAALQLAARESPAVYAVVSRGGRPDLAGREVLARVRAPTLLIVGGLDGQVIELNQAAYSLLTCEKRMDIVPGATHLFEEPGTLEQVARLACGWFVQCLGRA